MRFLSWSLTIIFWMIVAAFFHYTLPQKDIVRITDTENRVINVADNALFWSGPDAGTATSPAGRDVFFIQTIRADGSVMVYRNEDTGWSWPPYFKFDTSNLQAEAADLRSTGDNPKWALMTHYGWRIVYFSIFPNAVGVTPIESPEVGKPIPWVNIIVLTLFGIIYYSIWTRWRRFRQNRLDPAFEEIQDNLEATGDAIAQRRGRVRRWLSGQRG